jgi:hypothetical protein
MALIMENHFAMSSFVAQVASACLHRPVSMFWSHSTSIAIELTNFSIVEEGGECKGNLTILRRILHLDLAKGNPK